jgi:hypothetical protein
MERKKGEILKEVRKRDFTKETEKVSSKRVGRESI